MFNYARRGRGESGDTQPYALARELEDLAELIAVAGVPAHLRAGLARNTAREEMPSGQVPHNGVADRREETVERRQWT